MKFKLWQADLGTDTEKLARVCMNGHILDTNLFSFLSLMRLLFIYGYIALMRYKILNPNILLDDKENTYMSQISFYFEFVPQ